MIQWQPIKRKCPHTFKFCAFNKHGTDVDIEYEEHGFCLSSLKPMYFEPCFGAERKGECDETRNDGWI